ncbi:hypothetical protein [Halostagnicola kamekurae]|uniref:Uncharacterized protein n=1 Tax=Halostagnicola kamekurae TaxID=619731 RepID=A0A1I6UDZ3_9EURY|nr:hypothetical protein [Halostagnicola kamekurae]SFS99598.1 hypothetical protein SAMN04488556_3782 [Halostagnicola kamekurae]
MDSTKQGILGLQLTVVGLVVVTYFDGMSSLSLGGLFLALVGTVVTITAVANPP